jgi:hypothetical protein
MVRQHAAGTDSAPVYHVVVSFRIISRPTSVFSGGAAYCTCDRCNWRANTWAVEATSQPSYS